MSIACQTAADLSARITETVGARGKNYGPPEINFANIAAFWRAWLKARYGTDVSLDAADVAHMSALIKVARLAETPTHEDSALDGATYMMLGLGCAMDAQEREKGEQERTFVGVDQHPHPSLLAS